MHRHFVVFLNRCFCEILRSMGLWKWNEWVLAFVGNSLNVEYRSVGVTPSRGATLSRGTVCFAGLCGVVS